VVKGGGVEGRGGGNQVIKFRPPSQHLRREVQTTNPAAEPAKIRLRGIVRTVDVRLVLLHNGGFQNACTMKRSITLLCISKQSMCRNGVVP
jgi:hypothetical protein